MIQSDAPIESKEADNKIFSKKSSRLKLAMFDQKRFSNKKGKQVGFEEENWNPTGSSFFRYSITSNSLMALSHFTLLPSGFGSQYLKHVSGLASIMPIPLNL